jgi:uncharacterized protein
VQVSYEDRPLLSEGLYTDVVDGHVLYYNPKGYGGVTLADKETQGLLERCDGSRNLQQIVSEDGREADVVIQEIETLACREVVTLSSEFTQELSATTHRSGDSLACWLHLTNRCNLACVYCYIHKSPGDMSWETATKAFRDISDSCRRHGLGYADIKFAGGEPLIRFKLIRDLIEYARNLEGSPHWRFAVLTNGVLVTPAIAEYFAAKHIGVGVSLDGIGPVHDATRFDLAGRGSFQKVLRGLDRLDSAGVNHGIMVTITKANLGNLVELTQYALDSGMRFRFSLERDTETGRPQLLDYLPELIKALNACYDLIEHHLPSVDITIIHNFADTTFGKPKYRPCGAGWNYFAIGHDGALGVCGSGLAKPFGSLGDGPDIISTTRAANLELGRSPSRNDSVCAGCSWRSSCAGGCPLQNLSTNGTVNSASPYCEVYRQILPRILRIKGMQMLREHTSTI